MPGEAVPPRAKRWRRAWAGAARFRIPVRGFGAAGAAEAAMPEAAGQQAEVDRPMENS
ncbi:hypothetical protein QRO11_20770 [Paracidovorax citrulli]|uniref:hypothetical protein n=1 Tax=Paracidovorax citrulli TaxID=80869 RepID=UPI000A990AAD|nr:hypothetical protein [Paracidovorax citrulli]WIY34348.1 hypothetical protein QRO11_20770 [Paracidovorax citrulli]